MYPHTSFEDNHFTLSLISHFLFLYEDRLDYGFHKKTILELLRITSKEIRIFPIIKLNGEKSEILQSLLKDKDLKGIRMNTRKVDYEFMKGGNEMLVIKK